ncbi:hypothetical protein M3N64_10045 [Sporolactobacillus sp. CPB3-1]|uniref:Flagellar protein FliT n=1 Tax=Sporolactobacillus mangiferae TaxID=2940498 RepID=A0ABT0MCH8_9BACL|nr:hypothetical protein [Sporolactobacillus mangiferae]MCL1632278.1 hypothetical protein [Sporolactobacillus mangiferae]
MGLQKIYDLTVELEQLVTDEKQSMSRDELIAKLRQLLDARGRLTAELSGTCSEAERPMGERIAEMNRTINKQLHLIKQEITNDMNHFRHRKRSINRYRNPYTGPTKDGMFLDKRE